MYPTHMHSLGSHLQENVAIRAGLLLTLRPALARGSEGMARST